MSRYGKLILLALLGIGLALFMSPLVIEAQSPTATVYRDYVVLNRDQVINTDYFAAGKTVMLSGTVNGDAYVTGGNVDVDGVVNGDLIAAGGNVNIRGRVLNNVRVAGGSVNVAGEVGRNITVVGGSVNVAESAKVNGNLVSAGGNLSIFGQVQKDVNLAGGAVTLGNGIGGNVNAAIRQLDLAQNSKIGGNLTYWSDTPVRLETGATVSGQISQNIPPRKIDREAATKRVGGFLVGLGAFFKIVGLLSTLIIGLLLLRFVPSYSEQIVGTVVKRPGQSLLIGIITAIVTPLLSVVLLVTLVGIPLGLMLISLYLMALYIAKVFVIVVVGRKLMGYSNQKVSVYWELVIGLIIYYLVTVLPFVGGLVGLFVSLLGLGALVLEKKELYLSLRSKKLI